MADFAGEICQDRGRVGGPSRQRRAPRAPWGLPTPNVGSTYGQGWVSSLAIAGRFSLILPDSSIKTEDRRTCISQMVDFPIRKRDFRVRSWSGAFWEPLGRKKEKTKCIYKILIPLHRFTLKYLSIFVFNFAIFSTKFHHFLRILNQFHVISSRF